MSAPTITEAPQLVIDTCEQHHGLHVTACDEDGGHLILGHHPERRSIAALHAYGRSIGYDKGWMGEDYEAACDPLRLGWMVLDATPADPDAVWSGQWVREGTTPGAFPVTVWDPNR